MRSPSRQLFRVIELKVPNGKKYWKIEGRPSGVRHRYFFASEKEAKVAAADRNRQLTTFGSEAPLSFRDRTMAIDCIHQLAPFGKNLYEAVEFFKQHLSRQLTSVTVAALCDRILTEFDRRVDAKEISAKHRDGMKETLKKFRARFSDAHVKLLKGEAIEAWLAEQPLAVKTRNRHLGNLRSCFTFAQRWDLLDADPLAKVPPFTDPNRELNVAIFSPEQMTAFLNAVDPEFAPFFALNAFTGLRRAELERLDWSEIKLDRRLIELPRTKSKNGNRKVIEVPENLVAWLKLHVRAEGPVKPRRRLQDAMEQAAKKAGIVPWPQNVLRHSFCSYAVARRGMEYTAEQADHTLKILRKCYWEKVSKEDADRYWSIVPA
jgi:integrase